MWKPLDQFFESIGAAIRAYFRRRTYEAARAGVVEGLADLVQEIAAAQPAPGETAAIAAERPAPPPVPAPNGRVRRGRAAAV